jgi:AraC family transcriptional regulator
MELHPIFVTDQLRVWWMDAVSSPEIVPHLLPKQHVIKVLGAGSFEHGAQASALDRYSYAQGEMILARRDSEEWIRWTSPMKMLMVELSDHDLRAVAEDAGMSKIEIDGTPHLQDKRVAALISAVEAEQVMGFPSGRLYMDAMGQALAAAVIQSRGVLRRPLRSTHRGGLAPAQLRRVIEYIQEQIDRHIDVTQLAETAGLSSAHFSQMFRRSTGFAPHQYVLRARIERAKQMLHSRETRVIDIAVSCGFETPQHFARVFKRLCHATPTRYRRDRGCKSPNAPPE